jgi:hypothetical protein
MKKKFSFKDSGLLMILVLLMCSLFGVGGASAMTADVVTPDGGLGLVQVDEISSDQATRSLVPGLNLNDIERKVVVIRPMGNPLATTSRFVARKSATSRVQEYFSTDVLPVKTTLKTAYAEEAAGGNADINATIDTNNNAIFSAKETIFFPGVPGYKKDGVTQTKQFLMCYITSKTNDKKLVIKPVNGKKIGNVIGMPSLPANSIIIRAGRAHNEFDIQTGKFANLPTPTIQYLQNFKCQIEQSTLEKIANKQVDWTFNDQEQEAIFDMTRGMNKNFLIGAMGIVQDDDSNDVYMTGGIYWQAGKDFTYGSQGVTQITFAELVKLTEAAFTGNAGNKEKIFYVGSGLMTNLSLINYGTNQKDAATTFVKYGLTFKEITTNFGTLWVIHDESFDENEMTNSGLIVDTDFLRKYSIGELKATDLDLRKSGERNVDARTISEESALVLQNPNAHIRVELFPQVAA